MIQRDDDDCLMGLPPRPANPMAATLWRSYENSNHYWIDIGTSSAEPSLSSEDETVASEGISTTPSSSSSSKDLVGTYADMSRQEGTFESDNHLAKTIMFDPPRDETDESTLGKRAIADAPFFSPIHCALPTSQRKIFATVSLQAMRPTFTSDITNTFQVMPSENHESALPIRPHSFRKPGTFGNTRSELATQNFEQAQTVTIFSNERNQS